MPVHLTVTRVVTRTLVGLTAAAMTIALATTPASATAPTDGCPRGYVAHTIEQWAALGYPHAPASVDDPANGGNGDGIVCGRELGAGTAKQTTSGQVLYEFVDNRLPASS